MANQNGITVDSIPGFDAPPDAELDAAMREREAIQHAEHDLAVLREVWQRRTGKRPGFFVQRLIAFVAGGIAVAVMTFGTSTALADEEAPARVKRPVLCDDGQVMSGHGMAILICRDGKKPRVFTRFIDVAFIDANGAPHTYYLGWNAPLKRSAKGGYSAVPKRTAKLETL